MYDKKFGQWVICWEKERRLKEWSKLSEEAKEVRRLRRIQKKQFTSLCNLYGIANIKPIPMEKPVRKCSTYVLNSKTGFRIVNS